MLRRIVLALGLVAALGASAARAQTAPALSGDAQARMPLAMELVGIMRLPEFMRGTFPLIWRQMVAPLIARNDTRIKEAVDSLGPIIIAEMEGELPRFAEALARVYAANFSEEELRGLAAFMRSPIGQSYIGKQTAIAEASMAAGQQFGQSVFSRMRPRIEEELKKRLGDK